MLLKNYSLAKYSLFIEVMSHMRRRGCFPACTSSGGISQLRTVSSNILILFFMNVFHCFTYIVCTDEDIRCRNGHMQNSNLLQFCYFVIYYHWVDASVWWNVSPRGYSPDQKPSTWVLARKTSIIVKTYNI